MATAKDDHLQGGSNAAAAAEEDADDGGALAEERALVKVGLDRRESICRVANAVRVLEKLFLPVHPPAIMVRRCKLDPGLKAPGFNSST